MLRTLVHAALAVAIAFTLTACGTQEPAAPTATLILPDAPPEVPEEVRAANEAKEAAYRKHLDDGTKALAAGNLDAAIAGLKQATAVKSAGADAYYQLGRAYIEKKDDEAALAALNEAVRHDPRRVEAYMERASLHTRAGRFDEAGYDYYRVIDIDPDRKTTARAHWLRSGVADRQGKRETFLADREKAIQLDPSYATLVTAGDVRVFNHTDVKLKIAFEKFVNPDGSLRTFPPAFYYPIPESASDYLLDGNRHMPARSVRYTITTSAGSRTCDQTYERGPSLDIHIYASDLPR